MIPLIVLVTSFVLFSLLGFVSVSYFADYRQALRAALAVMFLLTASAHWGAKRPDLERMVPAAFGNPGLWVTLTGILEILGAIGLLIPSTARMAVFGLVLLLLAMFPANIRAARLQLSIGGRRVPPLGLRSLIQLVFLGSLILAGWS